MPPNRGQYWKPGEEWENRVSIQRNSCSEPSWPLVIVNFVFNNPNGFFFSSSARVVAFSLHGTCYVCNSCERVPLSWVTHCGKELPPFVLNVVPANFIWQPLIFSTGRDNEWVLPSYLLSAPPDFYRLVLNHPCASFSPEGGICFIGLIILGGFVFSSSFGDWGGLCVRGKGGESCTQWSRCWMDLYSVSIVLSIAPYCFPKY